MKKMLIISAMLLSGCEVEDEAQLTLIQTRLPEGCTIGDLGEYADIRHVLIVTCEGRDTLSLNGYFSRHSGKTNTWYGQTMFHVGGVQ